MILSNFHGRAPIQPGSMPGCVQWLDGYSLTTSPVAGWTDRTLSHNVPFQSNVGQRPTWAAGIVTFARASTQGLVDDFTLATGALTVGITFAFTTAPTSGQFMCLLSFPMSATKTFFQLWGINSAGYQKITFAAKMNGATTALGFSPTLDTSTHRLIVTYNNGTNTSAGSYSATLDGASQSIAGSSTLAPATTDKGGIGANYNSVSTPSNTFNGSIQKIRVYNRVLTAAEIARLDRNLADI